MVGCGEKYEEHRKTVDMAEDVKIREAREKSIETAETAKKCGEYGGRNEMVWAKKMKSIWEIQWYGE